MRNQILIAGLLAAVLLPMFSNDAEARCRRRWRRCGYTVSHCSYNHCAPTCCNHCGNDCHGGQCNVCNQGYKHGQNTYYENNNNNPNFNNNMNSGGVPQPMNRPNTQSPAAPAPPPPAPVR
ncbi:MAG: hypothetical protein JNM18_13660 [Planctomycetaceae bacterium]|nr:hypothetical protein [Planctomycetaceae bacterium]